MIDKNDDKVIDRNEFTEGLKYFGLHIAFVNNLLKIFDKDNSDTISLKEFLNILGDDI